MRNFIFLRTACLLCLIFVLGNTAFAQKSDNSKVAPNKSLQKSVEKLKNVLSKYGSYQDPNDDTKTYRIKPIKFSGCEVTFAYEILVSFSPPPFAVRNSTEVFSSTRSDTFLSPNYKSIVELNFAKVDAATIKVRDGVRTDLLFQSLKGQNAVRETNARGSVSLQETTVPISYKKVTDEIKGLFVSVAKECQTTN